jgi:hypothetical protein
MLYFSRIFQKIAKGLQAKPLLTEQITMLSFSGIFLKDYKGITG